MKTQPPPPKKRKEKIHDESFTQLSFMWKFNDAHWNHPNLRYSSLILILKTDSDLWDNPYQNDTKWNIEILQQWHEQDPILIKYFENIANQASVVVFRFWLDIPKFWDNYL
jgi:hypothetical protein